jgi:hypothetical protein
VGSAIFWPVKPFPDATFGRARGYGDYVRISNRAFKLFPERSGFAAEMSQKIGRNTAQREDGRLIWS